MDDTEAVEQPVAPVQAVRAVVTDDLQRRRLTVFFRLFMAIPHLLVLGAFGGVALLLAPFIWLVVLFRGRMPKDMQEFYARLVRYSVHVYAYLFLVADRWPPFMGEKGYEVDVLVPEEPVTMSRWSIGFRLFLALPPLFMASALGSGSGGGAGGTFTYNSGALAAVGFLGWWVAMVRARMAPGMRDLGVYTLQYAAQVYAYLLLLTPRYPDADPALAEAGPLPEHPIRLDPYEDDLKRNRLLVFFRGLIAVPHFLWTMLWAIAAYLAVFVGWWVTLFSGRLPDAFHRFIGAFVRYQTHVYGFVLLAAEPFPGFVGRPGTYPLDLQIDGRERQNRWVTFFRMFLAIPAWILASALGAAYFLAAIGAWFAALFTGRMPHGLRNLVVYGLRYQAQVNAYAMLLTDRYPYSGPGRCDRA